MTFGFSTIVDALSWATALLLSLKVVATVVLLRRDKRTWFQTRWSAGLWWATKVTPFLAVPCMIAIAQLQHRVGEFWAYGALMMFVIVAVQIVIWHRFRYDRQTVGD